MDRRSENQCVDDCVLPPLADIKRRRKTLFLTIKNQNFEREILKYLCSTTSDLLDWSKQINLHYP